MTTSGIYTVQYSRDDIIAAAMRKLGVLADGQTPSTTNYTTGMMALNTVLGMFRGLGMPMWKRTDYSFSPTLNTSSYNIGTGYTLNTPYPLKLMQVFRTSNGTKINMDIEADYTFNQLPTNSSGTPIKATYQPKNNYGVVQLWPTPDADAVANSTFTLVYQEPFQYFSASTDTIDFPEEWYLPIIYQTAVVLAPEWGIPLQDRGSLRNEAKEFLDMVLGMGGEDSSMFIQPYKQY